MIIIGITGNIASGKSTVTKLLKKKTKGMLIDADEVLKEVTKPNSQTWEKVVKLFGKGIIRERSKELNYRKIAEIVFKERAMLKKLEQITHPAIIRNIKQKINLIGKKAPQTIVCLEAIKLLDSALVKIIDFAILVTTQRENQFTRLIKDKDYTMAESLARIEAYLAPKKHPKIIAVVENDSDLVELERKVAEVADKILKH